MSCKYIAYSTEQCPKTNRIHVHMLIYFTDQIRYSCLRTCPLFDPFKSDDGKLAVNFKSIWDFDGAFKYISKPESHIDGPHEIGTRPQQGARTDLKPLDQAIEFLKDTKSMKQVAEAFPSVFVKHHNGLNALMHMSMAREPAPLLEDIILCIGAPGSGKSYWAKHNFESVYSRGYPKCQQWYSDGFFNEEAYFIDEMGGDKMSFTRFKELFQPGCDGRTITLPCSAAGTTCVLGSRVVVFASNRLPIQWWKLDELKADPDELFRRFTRIMVFGGKYNSLDDPAWVTELATESERDEFFNMCLRLKGGDWLDFITVKRELAKLFKGRSVPVKADVPMHDASDLTVASQSTSSGSKRKSPDA